MRRKASPSLQTRSTCDFNKLTGSLTKKNWFEILLLQRNRIYRPFPCFQAELLHSLQYVQRLKQKQIGT